MIFLIAAADLRIQDGVILSIAYGPVVLLGFPARRDLVVLVLAIAGTLATIAVGANSVAAGIEVTHIAIRGMTILVIWIIAVLVQFARHASPADHTTQELLEENDIFRAVFDQTFQFVAALDPMGNIVEANQTLRDYAGLTAGEIDSLPIWLLPIFHTDSAAQERLKAAIGAAANGDFIRDEFVVSGIGDRSTVIDLSLKPIRDATDAISQIIMEARDITDARMQQEMLVHAQKMEAVGELTAGVAHDFNNLLTVIVGNLELIQKRLGDDERLLNRVDRAIRAAFRGQALTQQLLAFSRRQSLNPIVIDVNTLLSGMSQLYESLGEEVTVEFALADSLPPCEVDPTLLETALLNIAINARDAMPEGGTLRFETSSLMLDESYSGEISDLPPGRYVCLTASDAGMGISEDVIPNVFDPFFTTKSEGQGTGLGLSMVYGFVRQSGGDVKIYSEKGKGTTVRIYLPVSEKPLALKAEAGASEQAEAAGARKSVLLVDDDEEVRDVILNVLLEYDWQVETAENGDEAIELIKAGNAYDLVFTDMVMAGDAGGPDVARAARAVLGNVPVVFCSGFPRKQLDGDEESVAGAFFLAKPFHRNELFAILERVFDGKPSA